MSGTIGNVKIRCPKCRSIDLTISETTEAIMVFDVSGGVMTRMEFSEDFGGFVGVYAACKKCAHRWKPRGAAQIYDLLKEPDQ